MKEFIMAEYTRDKMQFDLFADEAEQADVINMLAEEINSIEE
jgi:hypothetical protein